jgi:hypothetical protein
MAGIMAGMSSELPDDPLRKAVNLKAQAAARVADEHRSVSD